MYEKKYNKIFIDLYRCYKETQDPPTLNNCSASSLNSFGIHVYNVFLRFYQMNLFKKRKQIIC